MFQTMDLVFEGFYLNLPMFGLILMYRFRPLIDIAYRLVIHSDWTALFNPLSVIRTPDS